MRNEKILVVEFEESSLNFLLQTLQTEGFQVVTAKDGHEGLLMFESENPDLVILEPMLLKLHGFDLCRKISKDSNKKTPVIITTGFYKGEHYKSEAIETFGAAAFFEKPYKNEDLLTTIHELLGNGTVESIKEIKTTEKEKKSIVLDIEESVREMERSIKEQEISLPEQDQKDVAADKKTGEASINTQIDEMLQDALSDFGLSLGSKSTEKKGEKKAKQVVKKIKAKEKEPSEVKQEAHAAEKIKEKDGLEDTPGYEDEKELKTEELIEELIQKEEEIEAEIRPDKEEEPEVEAVPQEPEEKGEVEVEKEETAENRIGEEDKADQQIFEEYFEEPEKVPVHTNILRFLKKIKKSLPLKIGSTAFVVLVAVGATYLFLKPNKPKTLSNQRNVETVSNVNRSSSTQGQQELSVSPLGQDENSQGIPSDGPALEGGQANPAENTTPSDDSAGPEAGSDSTSEFMSTTGLSSRQRQVMLPEGAPSPESRQFETTIEVEASSEEQLGGSSVEISSPQLEEAVKNIIQSEDTSNRIKVGDLVPIDSVDTPPVATKKVDPKYPPAAFRRGIEATVVFRALISEFGNVLDVAFVDPTKTSNAFKTACDEAVRQWRFSPAKKNGVNVKVWKTFSITFKKNTTE